MLFEHIAVLMSLVFAVAMTHLLASATDLILARERVRMSWLHVAWMVVAALLLFTNWLALWDMRRVSHWTVDRVAIQFAFTVIQYFSCSLVSPKVPEEGPVDLIAFERRNAPLYISAANGLAIAALVSNYLFRDAFPQSASWVEQDLTIVPMIVLMTVATFVRTRWISWVTAAAMIAMTVFFVSQFTLT